MISYQQGKPHLFPLTQESSVVRSTVRSRSAEDYAFSADWLQIQRQFALLPYVVDLQAQIDHLRAKLEALEHQRDELLAMHSEGDDTITLRLDVEATMPARIVGEIDAPFYYFGEETEE